MAWVRQFLPEKAGEIEAHLRTLDDPPFAHPYHWAGFHVSGDA
jgi:CHAT domain-containing protein